ncbi:S53 family peptidase [Massilia luteola]|uniref:S53 family peptidase n=1 Tax=Massilia luteola TaxID=3081751 RepID=UPI002ACC21FA|nr:S53 family peptidase [Massilia sp. Gc5]
MKTLTAITVAIGVLTTSLAYGATTSTQFRVDKDARIVDLGLAPQSEVRQVTLSLAVKNLAAMEAHAAAVADPASPKYRQFLTPAQVGSLYGQDATSIAQVVNFLKAQGLTVTKVYANNLLISAQGTNAQLAAVFGSTIHAYQTQGRTYEAPAGTTAMPANLAGIVKSVHGLNGRPLFRSNITRQPASGIATGESNLVPSRIPTPNATAASLPGEYTVLDLAAKYDVSPLYAAGVTGAGKTIGIATLAGYRQSDAYGYWNALGLPVAPNRITDVLVDGGPLADDGPGSGGAGETTLDVQQSGGVAPGANIRVYLAPNANNGFLDMFATAVDENIVDTLSVSWGAAEVFNGPADLAAFHAVFVQAALQGIPVIAASGDAGAFDINSNFPYPTCTTLLTADHPASDTAVLAAGGTTLPHTQVHKYGSITIPTERAWAWDYLRGYITSHYGQTLYYSDYFPVGGGGGVSVDFARPSYQTGLAGAMTSAAAQSLYCKASLLGDPGSGYEGLIDLPPGVAGRNLPDVSLNADPYSGYLVYFEGQWGAGSGGTSFVAPQLNGIFTLIAAGKNSRLGMLHPQLYGAFKTYGYGATSPFRAITAGTNLYYKSTNTFNPATGLGSLDVANLARAFGVSL